MAKLSPDHLKLPRSPLWPALERQWLNDHPRCAACGASKNLQVHHKVPVHIARSLELDPTNLITLCQNEADAANQCHFHLGHLSNWFNFNRNIDRQASDALLLLYPRDGQPVHSKANNPNTFHVVEPKPIPPVTPLANPAAAAEPLPASETSPRPFRARRRRL